MVSLLLGTRSFIRVYIFFLYFLMICVNPKGTLNFPKFAPIHKPCVGCVDIDDPLDVYYSNLRYLYFF